MALSCIGRKFPSDLTLKNLTKDELIDLLKIAEHNYQVQVETSKRQYDLLDTYLKNMDFEHMSSLELLEAFLNKLGAEMVKQDNKISFSMSEITAGDLVKMTYDGAHLMVEYFRDGKALSLPQDYYCPSIVPAIVEVMYAIDYSKNLGQTFNKLA